MSNLDPVALELRKRMEQLFTVKAIGIFQSAMSHWKESHNGTEEDFLNYCHQVDDKLIEIVQKAKCGSVHIPILFSVTLIKFLSLVDDIERFEQEQIKNN